MNKHFDLVVVWNAWIGFCKKPMAYDLAGAFMFSLIEYSVIGLGGHYVLGNDARDSHYIGVSFAFITFIILTIYFGNRHGWLEDLLKNMDNEAEK